MANRRISKKLWVGSVPVGGDAPIAVQSMNSQPIHDVARNLEELAMLKNAGCEFSRLALPSHESVDYFAKIVEASPLPLVADIHFDYRLAIAALQSGAAGLRINPGNIRDRDGIRKIAKLAKEKSVPIRVGVNGGSLDQRIINQAGGLNAQAMVMSALEAIALLEAEDFFDICVSLKASNPKLMIESNLELAKQIDYPLHLGLTESGTLNTGIIRSATALAPLLYQGIGDTIRISLTADPVEEVRVAWEILKSLDLRKRGATLISCPGCGRTQVDIRPMAEKVEKYLQTITDDLTVAVMGCAVNGPGEAREADYGIAGGKEEYLVFAKGEVLGKYPEAEAFKALISLIEADINKAN